MTIKQLLNFLNYFDKDITIYDCDMNLILFRQAYDSKFYNSIMNKYSVKQIIKVTCFDIIIQTYESSNEELPLPFPE